ncbi:MAG: M1 family metallopeptidase, partial [Myxococcota bacterium]
MKRLVFLSLLGAFVASSACATQRRPARVGKDPLLRERRDSSPVDDEAPLGRLPADVLPLEYDLNLVVDPRKETFSGFAAIGVRLTRPRNHLWLHGVALQVKQAQVTLADGSTRRVDYQQLTPDGVVRISFRGQLEPQDVRLVLAYDAQFNRSAIGVFRRADGGREFAFTRFEATEARRAFPCFDEPGTKTPYRLTLTVPGEMEAFSNTAVELERKSADGKVRTLAFRQTEPLPTYQVAFAVGEFDVLQTEVGISSVRSQALKLRGIAIRGKEARLRKAMERVAPSVVALENYLGTAFPYEKLDMIAVPSLDLRGTWNAGLVGLSEARLFVDTDDVLIRDRLDHLLLRSLAGQWFGGLVTHLWWDELWLSEAFPAWLASRVAVTGESSGSGDRSSGASLAQAAMRSDRLSAARSVREPVSSTRDVRGAFDGVTETKGAAVLAMFEGYVGAESFQRALRQYLQKFAHGSAGTAQWLETLKDASKRELAASFMSFLTQSGVPLVETRLLCDAGRA